MQKKQQGSTERGESRGSVFQKKNGTELSRKPNFALHGYQTCIRLGVLRTPDPSAPAFTMLFRARNQFHHVVGLVNVRGDVGYYIP